MPAILVVKGTKYAYNHMPIMEKLHPSFSANNSWKFIYKTLSCYNFDLVIIIEVDGEADSFTS